MALGGRRLARGVLPEDEIATRCELEIELGEGLRLLLLRGRV